MKRNFILLFFLVSYIGIAQFNPGAPWMKELEKRKFSSKSNEPLKFQEIVDAFNEYWKDKDHTKKGSGYKPFKRWEEFWQYSLNDDGTLVSYSQILEANEQKKSIAKLADDSNWRPLGPEDFLSRATNNANLGRLNAIHVDPNNSDVYYAGAPAGGLWKSSNAGLTWIPLTDELPQIGVSAIVVDPDDSNIIYIGTGDDDALDTYSIGVLKSIDGGQTWNTTGLSFSGTSARIGEIYLDKTNGSNKVFVASSQGFYKSIDGGDSFTRTLAVDVNDAKIKPSDPNTIYAVSDSSFYKSINNGDSFVQITNGLPTGSSRIVIDITPADDSYVYLLTATIEVDENNNQNYVFQGLYKSVDSGNTFNKTANTTNLFEVGQAWYDMAIAVSDTNPEEVYTGELNIWKSSNGGDTFTRLNDWAVRNDAYTHADIHFLRFFDGVLYCGSDGGFFRSDNGGVNFIDLTKGMNISQFYKIAVSNQNSSKIAGGTQDNGSFGLTSNGQWNVYGGGDGMDATINPNNENLYYGFMQNGENLWVSNNAGESLSFFVPKPTGSSGNWITPLDSNKEGEVFAAYDALYRLDGTSFTKVSRDLGGAVDELEIDPSNPDNIYISINKALYKSSNRGATFAQVETFTRNIVSIEVHSSDSAIIYVVTSGSGGKVYRSTNGGSSFSDITGNLPNIPKLDIAHQGRHSDNPLFIGTSIGVYRIDDTKTEWEIFENNLPNSPIRDLEINLEDGNITAATYGRGVWQSSIPVQFAQNDIRLLSIETTEVEIKCEDVSTAIRVMNNGLDPITSVEIQYMINGNSNNFTWSGNIASTESSLIDLPQVNYDFGINELEVTATIINDAYVDNNTKSVQIIKNNAEVGNEINEFENIEDELLAFDSSQNSTLWERGVPSGTLLNLATSGQNVYATNLDGNYSDLTVGYLISGCYDLSSIENPVLKFNMAFDLEQDWDFVNVEYSLNNGNTWQILGQATDPNWYNSDRLPNGRDCFNCPGAQWTGTDGTMKEYSYDLTAFTNESNFMFRFNFVSDLSENQEGVVIDDLTIEGNLLSITDFENRANFVVYPNPSKNIFNVEWSNASSMAYEIYDVTGKIISTNKYIDSSMNEVEIDLSSHSKGIYFMKIKLDNRESNVKLLKN